MNVADRNCYDEVRRISTTNNRTNKYDISSKTCWLWVQRDGQLFQTLSRRCFSFAILAGVIRFFFGPRFFGWLAFSSSYSLSSIWVTNERCCVTPLTCVHGSVVMEESNSASSSSEALNDGQQLDETMSQSDDELFSIGISAACHQIHSELCAWTSTDTTLQCPTSMLPVLHSGSKKHHRRHFYPKRPFFRTFAGTRCSLVKNLPRYDCWSGHRRPILIY